MPFVSPKQRRFMHAKHPEVAEKWERKYGSKPKARAKAKARKR